MSCMIYFLFNNYEVFWFMFFDMIIIYVGFGLSYAIKYLGFDTTQTDLLTQILTPIYLSITYMLIVLINLSKKYRVSGLN